MASGDGASARQGGERTASSPTRAWGLGLMGLGAAVGGLLLLWTLVTAVSGDLRGGGFVLWLIVIAVVALPLFGGGYYLLRQSAVEARTSADFEARRRVFEGDRVFRQQAAADLQSTAARLNGGEAVGRLTALAATVGRAPRDEAAWYESDPLGDADLATLRRYEDTLQAESDRLADLASRVAHGDASAQTDLGVALDRWERTFRQREGLLLRGRRAASVAPEDLLRARTPTRGTAALNALALRDAVTVDFEDYLVQAVLTYFAEGRTWHLYVLRDGDVERWLWGAPGGLEWALLEPQSQPPPPGSATFEGPGGALRLAEQGSATVEIATAAGVERGISVDYWRYTGSERDMAWVERWPREVRAGLGRLTLPDMIDVWPHDPSAVD